VLKTRRLFLCALGTGVVALPMSTMTYQGIALAAETPKLDSEDPAAKALGYVRESPNAAKRCAGCQLYKGSGTAKWGRCAIFSGKLVSARGWCQSWSA
jgi:hypothetical protein